MEPKEPRKAERQMCLSERHSQKPPVSWLSLIAVISLWSQLEKIAKGNLEKKNRAVVTFWILEELCDWRFCNIGFIQVKRLNVSKDFERTFKGCKLNYHFIFNFSNFSPKGLLESINISHIERRDSSSVNPVLECAKWRFREDSSQAGRTQEAPTRHPPGVPRGRPGDTWNSDR